MSNISLENGEEHKPNNRQGAKVRLETGGKISLKICGSNGQ